MRDARWLAAAVIVALVWFSWMFRYEPVRYILQGVSDQGTELQIAWDRWFHRYDFDVLGDGRSRR